MKFEDYLNGIDVSNIQGDINWQAVADAGYKFAYIKSSQYSRIRDNKFWKNHSKALKEGIVCGAYHACSIAHGPGNLTDPKEQMKFFYDACEQVGSRPGDLPPMLDWEVNTANSPELAVGWLLEALEAATELWYPDNAKRILAGKDARYPVVYTYPVFAQAHQPFLMLSAELKKYPLCFASYRYQAKDWHPSMTGRQEPFQATPKPWAKTSFWQHTGNGGRVPGVPTHCDKQVYLGSGADFDKLCDIQRPANQMTWEDK